MIPVKVRLDAIARLKEVYPHLGDDFMGFHLLAPYLGKTVYVYEPDLSCVEVILNENGGSLIRGGKVGVALYHLLQDKTFNDYL